MILKDIEEGSRGGRGRSGPANEVAAYDYGRFQDMRFLRNKLVHFSQSHPDFRRCFQSPEDLITHFNEHVVSDDDLVFALWKHLEESGMSRFSLERSSLWGSPLTRH